MRQRKQRCLWLTCQRTLVCTQMQLSDLSLPNTTRHLTVWLFVTQMWYYMQVKFEDADTRVDMW